MHVDNVRSEKVHQLKGRVSVPLKKERQSRKEIKMEGDAHHCCHHCSGISLLHCDRRHSRRQENDLASPVTCLRRQPSSLKNMKSLGYTSSIEREGTRAVSCHPLGLWHFIPPIHWRHDRPIRCGDSTGCPLGPLLLSLTTM